MADLLFKVGVLYGLYNFQKLSGSTPGVCGRKFETCYCVHCELVVLRGEEIVLIQ